MGDSSLGTSEPFGQAQTLLPDSLGLCRPPLPRWVFLLQPPPTPHPGPGRQSLPSLDTDHHHPPALSPRRGRGKEPPGGQHRLLLWRGDKSGTPEEVATPD